MTGLLEHAEGGRRWVFAGAVASHLVVLYWPFGVSDPGLPGLDKLVHAAVFATVALAGRRAGVGVRPLVIGLALHAVVSEVVQGALLHGRSADPLDVVADLVGTAVGLAAAGPSARWFAAPRRDAR